MYFTDSNVAKDDLDGFKMKIRYIFVFLGPKGQFSYLEIGRCMGNLMNNHDFKTAIYRAKTSHELIHSITNYANNSLCLVLPTGEFNAELLKTMSDWVHKKMKKEDKNYQKPSGASSSRTSEMGSWEVALRAERERGTEAGKELPKLRGCNRTADQWGLL